MKLNKLVSQSEAPERGTFNTSYLMILLNTSLSDWAKKHKLTTSISSLMFVVQIESVKLDDIYLTLVYDDGNGNEKTVHAGYVGQTLTKKERKYCEKLPFFTGVDLNKKPPYDVIMKGRLSNLRDTTGILHCVALGFHNLMVETCNLSTGINGALATNNGTAILFVRDNDEYVTKIEFYLKDIINFINDIEKQRTETIRNSIKTLITKEKHA